MTDLLTVAAEIDQADDSDAWVVTDHDVGSDVGEGACHADWAVVVDCIDHEKYFEEGKHDV